MNDVPRRQRLVRLALLAGILGALSEVGVVRVAGAQQAANGNVSATAVPYGVTTSPLAGVCTSDSLDARSEPGYQGTYSITDRRGGRHSYSGPLFLTIGADVFENQQGTFQNAQCAGNAGFSQPIRGASASSPPEGTGSLACSYDPAQSTYRRYDRDLITVVLVGTCTITQGGVAYVAAAVETHQGRVFERNLMQPQPPGSVAGTGLVIRWSEAYTFSTTCISASCDTPGPAGASTGLVPPGSGPVVGGVGPAAKTPGGTSAPQAPAGASAPPSAAGAASPAGGAGTAEGDSVLYPTDDAGLEADTEGAGSGDASRGRRWPRGLVALALLTLGVGEAASYRKQKRAGRPAFPLLTTLRVSLVQKMGRGASTKNSGDSEACPAKKELGFSPRAASRATSS